MLNSENQTFHPKIPETPGGKSDHVTKQFGYFFRGCPFFPEVPETAVSMVKPESS